MLISLSLLVTLAMPTCTMADRGLEKLIRDKAGELGGHEYCQFRMYDSLSDLDGDNKADFVVVFTVEGAVRGSKDVQFLAIFLSGARSAPIVSEFGRRGYRVVTALEVSPPDIVLRALEYQADE